MQFQGGNNVLQRSRSEPDFEIDYQQIPIEQEYNDNSLPMAQQEQGPPDETQHGRAQKKLVEQDQKLKKMQQERKNQDQMLGKSEKVQQQNINFKDPIPRTKMMSNYGPQPAQGFNQSMNNQEDYERENQRQYVENTTTPQYPQDMYGEQEEQQQMMQMQDEGQNEEWEQDQPYFIKETASGKTSQNKFTCFFIIGIFMSILLFYKISKDNYSFIPRKYSVASYILVILSLSFIVTTILTR